MRTAAAAAGQRATTKGKAGAIATRCNAVAQHSQTIFCSNRLMKFINLLLLLPSTYPYILSPFFFDCFFLVDGGMEKEKRREASATGRSAGRKWPGLHICTPLQ